MDRFLILYGLMLVHAVMLNAINIKRICEVYYTIQCWPANTSFPLSCINYFSLLLDKRGKKRTVNSAKLCISSGAANCKLLVQGHRWHSTAWILARYHYRAQERPLNILRCISPQQAHDILHHDRITGQCDPPITGEPEFLLWHPQELAKDRCSEVRQWHLESPPVCGVHSTMALVGDRRIRAAGVVFPGGRRLDPLQPPRQLSKPLGMYHGWLFFGSQNLRYVA